MILGALLLAIGLADLARPSDRAPSRAEHVRAWVILIAAVVALSWVTAQPAGIAVTAVGIGGAWIVLGTRPRTAIAGLFVLAAGLAAAVFGGDPDAGAGSPLDLAWQALRPQPLAGVDAATAVLTVGALTFLVNSANLVTRVVTSRALRETRGEERTAAVLRGGRFLGPIERIVIVGLVLAGLPGGIAVVVTAKSVIRFPEISGSAQREVDAEYFLIGSGVSWGLALLAGLWISVQ
ncbi:MAG: hypothetical protein R2717_03330 [Schumannella sp.]|nr:hypothetical protein [Microbacteriaceae bacterium]